MESSLNVSQLTIQQIQDTYGATLRQARRWKENGKIPTGKKPREIKAENDATLDYAINDTEKQQEGIKFEGVPFSAEEAPVNTFPQESAMDKVFKKLGLEKDKEKAENKANKVYNPHLNKAQQSVFDSFSPIAVQTFIFVSGWIWTQIGPEYRKLVPDKQVAGQIVNPLVRIYARHSKIATSLDPDAVDASASIAALIGYVWSSMAMYNYIKEQVQNGQEIRTENNDNAGYVEYEPTNDTGHGNGVNGAHKNGHGSKNARRNAIRADSSEHGADNESNGFSGNIDGRNFSTSEQYQYEQLSKLRKLDIEARARRSGSR